MLGLIGFPAVASAHEFWLTPSTYRAAAGDTIMIAAFVGTGFRGERKPFAVPRVVRFTLQATKTLDLSRAALNGDLSWARFITADDRGALIGYESNFTSIELPAAEFDAYLKLEGLNGPLAARAKLGPKVGPGRERYARCPKTWIAGSDPGRLAKPISLSLELVPLGDPESSSPARFRLLFHGHPLAGALVRAWHQPFEHGSVPRDGASRDSVGPVAEARTDRGGVATLGLSEPGEWLVSAVHMVPCPERDVADWQSLWASITFGRETRRP